jgi:uncharacterized protein YndB with AHSA1/START domain
MSIKIEPNGRRSIEVAVEIPATPEEVWEAIATGPGVSAWFVPCEIDGRVGGAVTCHFGPGMDSTETISKWDPPRMFACDWGEADDGAPHLASEWYVEALGGGVCRVRVVNSLFASTDDWDDQLESVENGWPSFFRILKIYLAHFRGARSARAQALALTPKPVDEAWDAVASALGLDGLEVGAEYASSNGALPLAGIVEHVQSSPFNVLVRTSTPRNGIVSFAAHKMGGPTGVMVAHYLYGDGADEAAAREESAWAGWLAERFPDATSGEAGVGGGVPVERR